MAGGLNPPKRELQKVAAAFVAGELGELAAGDRLLTVHLDSPLKAGEDRSGAGQGLVTSPKGRPVPEDELIGSDIILPPLDVSLEEAQAEFQGEGLIPG